MPELSIAKDAAQFEEVTGCSVVVAYTAGLRSLSPLSGNTVKGEVAQLIGEARGLIAPQAVVYG